jgi:hypothetical protein
MSSGGNRPVNSTKECEIIAGATVDIKARVVTVKGKRGTLVRDFKHLNVEIYKSKNAKTGKDVVIVSFLWKLHCDDSFSHKVCKGAVLFRWTAPEDDAKVEGKEIGYVAENPHVKDLCG